VSFSAANWAAHNPYKDKAMKRVLVSILFLASVLSWSHPAAGQAGSSLNDQLIAAAQKGDTATVQQLLDKGANIEATREGLGWTALIMAAGVGKIEVVELLLARGANIEARDSKGKTALIEATISQVSTVEVVKVLLEKGANFEARDNKGMTALIEAAIMGRTADVELLLAKGANIDAKSDNGGTALWWADSMGQPAMVKLLREKGAH
jgi:ankyrin repeat protein